jgi:hypothetical protein
MRALKLITLLSFFLCGLAFTTLGLAALKRDVAWAGRVGDDYWVQFRVFEGSVYFVHAWRVKGQRSRQRRGFTLLRGNFGTLGFYRGNDRGWRWVSATLPLWLVVGTLVIPSATAIVRGPLRRRYRLRRGLCIHCGYDARGCAMGRCSECGADVAAGRASERTPEVTV